jgi:hypothetical protein
MHGVSGRATAETEQVETVGDVRPLNSLEQALLGALSDEFVSASVVRERARLRMREASPCLAETMLSRDLPIALATSAFYELERRGLAEQSFVARCVRWRRARATQTHD